MIGKLHLKFGGWSIVVVRTLRSETCDTITMFCHVLYTLQQLRSTSNLVSVNNKVEIKTAMAKFLWVTIPNFQILSTFSIINSHLIRSMQVQVLMYCLKTTKFMMQKAKCNCLFILLWWYLNLSHVITCCISNHTPWPHTAQWLVTCTLCNHVQLLEGSASV